MTEQTRSTEDRKPAAERIGRKLGVALFWLLALGFVTVSTRSVTLQVFGHDSASDAARSPACLASLGEAAKQLHRARTSPGDTQRWGLLLDRATESCGQGDHSIQEMTAVVLRMQKRVSRNERAMENEQQRLSQVLGRASAIQDSAGTH